MKNKKILITGGLGMIGTTLTPKLSKLGAEVTIIDSLVKPFGGNFFNINDVKKLVTVNISDIRDKESMKVLIKDKDIVFNLAAQVSHNDSLQNPSLDADINYIGHLNVLEAARNYNPAAKIIHAGSRLQFGKILKNPVSEDHPLNPLTPYALNKTAAENLYLYYNRVFNIPVVIFRIANPYGPRCQMQHSKYTIINWFIRNAMEDKEIIIYGNGEQIRDYIFVEDLADAFILASDDENISNEVFNLGSGTGTRFKDMVQSVVETVGKGKIKFVPWPPGYLNIETGDYITDISKIKQFFEWSPKIKLDEGISITVDYYNRFKKYYW
ncbi:MAG: GDP-mannose 4,6-dehydratase [Bacteroidetes bacterium]|nr:GDP-mannose 4,6-dehydratase [Bacteroidota bacterium]